MDQILCHVLVSLDGYDIFRCDYLIYGMTWWTQGGLMNKEVGVLMVFG
jgi:hypothetical protein